jgi:hypothetical protein
MDWHDITAEALVKLSDAELARVWAEIHGSHPKNFQETTGYRREEVIADILEHQKRQ